jgi:hypothetical protein
MKLDFLTLGVLCLTGLAASCSRQNTTSDEPASAEESVVVVSTPSEAPAIPPPVVAAPAPPAKRLAPDGMFFLLTKKSVETDAGIVGLRPGAQVIRQPDGKFLADGHLLELAAGEITNDLDLAARVAGADARAQAAIRQTLAARPVTAPEASAEVATTNSTSDSVSPPANSAQRFGSSLGGTNALGASHTRTQNGWLYQKNSAGEWEPVRPIR